MTESAQLPFSILTVWRSLIEPARSRRAQSALVMGGHGKVGRVACQLLQHAAGVGMVEARGREGYEGSSTFDIVVDASSEPGGLDLGHLLHPAGLSVSYNGPWLRLLGELGVLRGTWQAAQQLCGRNVQQYARNGALHRWGLMRAHGGRVLTLLAREMERGSLALPANGSLVEGLEQLCEHWDDRLGVVRMRE